MLPPLIRGRSRGMLRQQINRARGGEMYAQTMGTSTTSRVIQALGEEPGFRGFRETPSGTKVTLWESESAARWPMPDFGGRMLNLYRASGRPS
jgi:hypothetical protein